MKGSKKREKPAGDRRDEKETMQIAKKEEDAKIQGCIGLLIFILIKY